MAFYANPGYGYIPGAPQATHRWIGNQFVMSDLPPIPPAPLPPVSTAATPTPQDVATQVGAGMLAPQQYGGTGGSGGPGGGPGGIGGASGGGQDTTTSGYQGVYAQSPVDLQSRFGEVGGLVGAGAGSLSGIPGVGTVLGFGGGMLDAARYNATNAQYGLPGNINPWGAGFAQALAGIGVPFTDLNLARAFGVPTAQQRQEALINAAAPGLYNNPGYGALQADQPVSPVTRESDRLASYPAGFIESSLQPSHGMPTELARALNLDAERTIAANPDIFGAGKGTGPVTAAEIGAWSDAITGKGGVDADRGQSTGYGGDKGDTSPSPGGSGDTSRQGGDGGYKYRGGLIGPPPGRYAAGGRVASNAAVRRAQPTHEYSRPMAPPPREISDRDFYVSPFSPLPGNPDYARGFGNPGGGAMRYAPVPGTGDRMQTGINPTPFAEYYDPEGEAGMGGTLDAARDQYYGPSYAVGGKIPPAAPGDNISPAQFGLLRGINPPGPDDQIGALQTGEGVITAKAMGKGWGGLLGPINAGKIDPAKLKGLLAAKPRRPR